MPHHIQLGASRGSYQKCGCPVFCLSCLIPSQSKMLIVVSVCVVLHTVGEGDMKFIVINVR